MIGIVICGRSKSEQPNHVYEYQLATAVNFIGTDSVLLNYKFLLTNKQMLVITSI